MTTNGTIKVEGRGSIHVVPDVTRLTIRVKSVFKTYSDSYARAQENTHWIREILTYNKKNADLKQDRQDGKEILAGSQEVAGNAVQKRRLTRTIGPEQREHLAFLHAERNVLEHVSTAGRVLESQVFDFNEGFHFCKPFHTFKSMNRSCGK